MRNAKKKAMCAAMACILAATTFSGCMNKTEQTTNTSGDNSEVTLKWVFGGTSKQKDADMVWEEFNKQLKEKLPNTTIEFQEIPLADYGEKWRLMAASAENIDIAWHGWMNSYTEEVQKGSFMALDSLLDQYAPDLKKELPEWVWERQKVNGKIYSIPNYQMMTEIRSGMRTPKEYADKYMNKQKIETVFANNPITNKECYDAIAEYLEALKKNGVLGKGVSPSFHFTDARGYEPIVANAIIRTTDDKLEVVDSLTLPDEEIRGQAMREWFEAGYIRKDILGLQNYQADEGKMDGYSVWVHSNLKGEAERESKRFGFPIEVISLQPEFYITSAANQNNTVVARTCKDTQRTMKFLELMHTPKGKDLYNLLVWGLEGQHYKKIGENRIEPIGYSGQATGENNYGLFKWAMGNTFYSYLQTEDDGYDQYIKEEVNGKAKKSKLMGFTLNVEPIKMEIAQYSAVEKEFSDITCGAFANYKELIQQRNEKLKKAGSDKIIQEVQRQIDEWAAKNGKK